MTATPTIGSVHECTRCEDLFAIVEGATHPIEIDMNTGGELCDYCAKRVATFAMTMKGCRINICDECDNAEAIDSDHGMCDECLQESKV